MRSLLASLAFLGLSFSAGAQTMVATGECQRFDGVWVFPLAARTPEADCRVFGGLWVAHVVPADAVPDVIRQVRAPAFLPYEVRR